MLMVMLQEQETGVAGLLEDLAVAWVPAVVQETAMPQKRRVVEKLAVRDHRHLIHHVFRQGMRLLCHVQVNFCPVAGYRQA